MTIIGVVNQSKRIPSSLVRRMVSACNVQIKRDCAPLWDATPWKVKYYTEKSVPKSHDLIPIVIFDEPDEADALGYHSETPWGERYGKVFVNPILDNGGDISTKDLSVSVTLSHECIEGFVDPDINLWSDGPHGRLYAYEAADPVEAQSYNINGISVSNFVTRAWFDLENPPGTRFDFLSLLKKPFTLAPGGYAIWMDSKGEHVTFAKGYSRWRKKGKSHLAARTARRKKLI